MLIGEVADPVDRSQHLVKALGGLPLRVYDPAEDVAAIVAAVTHMLGC